MICKYNSLLETSFLDEPGLTCSYTVKWFQFLISHTNTSICMQLNGFNYCYLNP